MKEDNLQISDIEIAEDSPPHDPILSYLLDRVVEGALQLYQGEVPLEKIVPASTTYDVKAHPGYHQIIPLLIAKIKNGEATSILLYPHRDHYITADDYFWLVAHQLAGSKYLHAFIIGEATVAGVQNLTGPASAAQARKILGLLG